MIETREQILERLLAKKEEFQKAIKRLMESQKEDVDLTEHEARHDESDQAQREIMLSSLYGLIEKKIQELRGIERLLELISHDEEFGICEECGEPIPLERLMAVPEATLCVPCQSLLERRSRARNLSATPTRGLKKLTDEGWEDLDETEALDAELRNAGIDVYPVTDLEPPDPQDLQE